MCNFGIQCPHGEKTNGSAPKIQDEICLVAVQREWGGPICYPVGCFQETDGNKGADAQ